MGKFRSKLKGRTKGKRWPKGQSSNSNPETTKHRDQAKSRFFQENLGHSSLTYDALKHHNAVQTFNALRPSQDTKSHTTMEEDTETEGTVSSATSLQTFATDWSECSNVSFAHFLKVFHSDSALHKEMLAILAAVAEVIKQNGGSEKSTEYYAALMTTLEVSETEESVTAVLSLLNMGLRSVPQSVLRLQFSEASKIYLQFLNKYAQSENNVIIKSLLGCISTLLRAQEQAVWSNSSTVQVFDAVLTFCTHSKPKIRKAAQNGVCSILKGSSFMTEDAAPQHHPAAAPQHHPAAAHVAKFCVQLIEGVGTGPGQTTTLHTLGLLKDIIHAFPKAQIKSACETVLKIMTVNNPLVNSCGMQVLHSLFSASRAAVPANLNGQLITALYDYQPAQTDAQPTMAWVAVMQQAHVHLADVDLSLSCAVLPKIVTALTKLWLTERTEIMNATTHALQAIVEDCVTPACDTQELANQYSESLDKCFGIITSGLSYQYNKAWHHVLHLLGVVFKVAGRHCSNLLRDTLKSLAELRDSYKFSFNNELEYAVGAAIKSMGPDVVLQVISLKGRNDDVNLDRSWLLPVLKENIQNSTLEYFVNNILPLASMCQRKSSHSAANNQSIASHSYELLYSQLWHLLPSFCNNPSDVKTSFKSIAKVLGTAVSERKELRSAVMASLRKLINSSLKNENTEDVAELARFAKNYLPILFNVYTTKPVGTDEEGQRLAALDTIKTYLRIAPSDLTTSLFDTALERIRSMDDSEPFVKESVLDLVRVLIPYQNVKSIGSLYEQCVRNLVDIKNNKEQKKAYRILEEICSSESQGCKDFVSKNRKDVQKLLTRSLSSAIVSSKGSRLRCFNYLLKAQSHTDHESKLLRSVVPEAVLCCKDPNQKCRAAAYALLNTIGELLLRCNQMEHYVSMLLAGLAGNVTVMSTTILAIASITHNFSGSLGMENIKLFLENVCQLLTASAREIVASCLSFVKVYITSLPTPVVIGSVPLIIKSLSNMTEDCKRHFRLKVRDLLDRFVRKYGSESVLPHVPSTDAVMQKRVRNLVKLNRRKAKRKEETKKEAEGHSDDDDFTVKAKPKTMEEILAESDSDMDQMEVDGPPVSKKKINTWIEEDADNIIDFMDPSSVSKIRASKPGQIPLPPKKEKDGGFKTAEDGRLIIEDDSDSGDDNKKDVLKFDSESESDDDGRSTAETLLLGNRKRKRSDTASMRSGASSQPGAKYRAGGSGIHRPLSSKGGDVGSEYRGKKAKGDVKKKGKPDPYAYLPLKRNFLNKRKKMKAAGQFKNIVRAAKSGAKKGTKLKKGRKNT